MTKLSTAMLAAGVAEFKRRHGDACYPVAYDWEAEGAAVAIYVAMEKARILASADTHPNGGDVKQAPLVSGAVPREDEADAQPQDPR